IEAQAEFVTLDCACRRACWTESTADVALFETIGIKHLLQTRRRAVMQIVTAIPDTLEHRHLVIAGPLPRSQRETWISADRHWQDVERLRDVGRQCETSSKGDLVARVERRSMTRGATLA